MPFQLLDKNISGAKIKVIGVGGCGGNAVNHMLQSKIEGVEFICVNTDVQDLAKSSCETKLAIGTHVTKGLGAGAVPEVGRRAALESEEQLNQYLQNTDMLFIAAGMGGGTGTGAAPVIAQLARANDILTVAVVTKPFRLEGRKKMRLAEEGIDELSKVVDSLICIPNNKLREALGGDATLETAYAAANDVLKNAVKGISELITVGGMMNVDFNDVSTVMSGKGMAMMGAGCASGENRAINAAKMAISSPLLEDCDIKGAEGILVNIMSDRNITMDDIEDIGLMIEEMASEDATVILGAGFDDNLDGQVVVTIVAAGWENQAQAAPVVTRPNISIVPRTADGKYDYDTMNTSPLQRGAVDIKPAAPSVRAQESINKEIVDIPAFLRRQAD